MAEILRHLSDYLSELRRQTDFWWMFFGFVAQGAFFMRFFVQWLVSERQKKSVIPNSFWYFSLAGGIMLLTYAIHRKDAVFILGQATGVFIYLRNIMLIRGARTA